MNKITFLIFILISCVFGHAQTATGNIETYVGSIIDNVPGSSGNDYVEPNSTQLTTWDTVIDFLLADDLASARSTASGINYKVTEFTDTSISPNQIFYILEEINPESFYWGTYIFSKTPKRGNLIIQAPHIRNDLNTGKQAIRCFKSNVAKAVFISGTHRCNNTISSTCSGTTSTCNEGSEAYRVSDMAHNTTSMFHKTTENLFTNIPESVFIQLHGFGWSSGDPYVIMSNGTRETPEVDYATLIQNALLVEDNTLTFELAHINTSWNTLTGFTNTQGRLNNYSTDICTISAEGTSGRFIHVEQELSKLRSNVSGWDKMSNALASVFVEDSDGDGVTTVSDTDDNDKCNPNPYYAGCNVCDVIITSDNFDSASGSDLGNWNDGGNNAYKSEINALGDKSIRLKHGIEVGNADPDVDPQSSIFTNSLDLSVYTQLKIHLSYFPPSTDGYENGDDFLLEISTDGGANFSTYKSWVAGTDFTTGARYFESVLVSGITFTSTTVIRIRSHADDDLDRVYVDNIVVYGCDDSALSIDDINLVDDFKVYPNPTLGNIIVKGIGINTIEVYTVLGEKIKLYRNDENDTSVLIDLKNQKSGVYFLKIHSSNGVFSRKVIRME